MPSQRLLRAFVVLWWTLGAVILVVSLRSLRDGLWPAHQLPLVVLAGTEAVAALLFLLPQTMRVGAVGLLVVLAIAFLLHLLALHEFRSDLLLFSAAVYFVAVHGSLSKPQWRHLASRG
jgi:hypothetical protein